MIDDDSTDPGPHTCVYVGTDAGDECKICGRDSDPFRDLHDEWDLGPEWDVSDAEEPLGILLPDYDYQGGG